MFLNLHPHLSQRPLHLLPPPHPHHLPHRLFHICFCHPLHALDFPRDRAVGERQDHERVIKERALECGQWVHSCDNFLHQFFVFFGRWRVVAFEPSLGFPLEGLADASEDVQVRKIENRARIFMWYFGDSRLLPLWDLYDLLNLSFQLGLTRRNYLLERVERVPAFLRIGVAPLLIIEQKLPVFRPPREQGLPFLPFLTLQAL